MLLQESGAVFRSAFYFDRIVFFEDLQVFSSYKHIAFVQFSMELCSTCFVSVCVSCYVHYSIQHFINALYSHLCMCNACIYSHFTSTWILLCSAKKCHFSHLHTNTKNTNSVFFPRLTVYFVMNHVIWNVHRLCWSGLCDILSKYTFLYHYEIQCLFKCCRGKSANISGGTRVLMTDGAE